MSLLWKTASEHWDPHDDEEAREEFDGGYLHVSPHVLEPGTVLTPGSERGEATYPNARNDKVFLTPHEDLADAWAQTHGWNAHKVPEQMHVYEVEPEGQVTHYQGDYGAEASADRARVKRHLYSIDKDDPDSGWSGR